MTHQAQAELLPCPFCGDHAETDYIPEHHSYAIECYSIGCAARVIKETAEDAIAAWNRRQPVARTRLTPYTLREIIKKLNANHDEEGWNFGDLVREVEAYHGITQEKQG
jgi:Lar family restriction alleviation protein